MAIEVGMSDRTPESSTIKTGATITSLYVERSVTTYAIPEHELDSISLLNNQVALWSSLGTGFLFLLFSCCWDYLSADAVLPDKAVNVMYLFAILAVVCYAFSGLHYIAKKSRVRKIKQEAGQAPRQSVPMADGSSRLFVKKILVVTTAIVVVMLMGRLYEIYSEPKVSNAIGALGACVALVGIGWVWWHVDTDN